MNQELGSLAQSARGNQLKSARWIMIFVGVLTIAINGFAFATTDGTLDREVAELQAQGYEIDKAELANLSFSNKLLTGGFAATGVLFILLGILVYQFPVPCTVTGLVLYRRYRRGRVAQPTELGPRAHYQDRDHRGAG